MTLDPRIIGLTAETRRAELWGDARRRIAILERGGGVNSGVPGASPVTSVADTTNIELDVVSGELRANILTTAIPQVLRLGIGTAAGPTEALTLQNSAMTNLLVKDQAHGAIQNYYGSAGAGLRWDIRHGSSGSPVVNEGATFKVSRYEKFVDGTVTQGADFPRYSAIHGIAVGDTLTTAQPVGVSGVSWTTSEAVANGSTRNPDACGVIGAGVVHGSGTGVAMGAHFEGHRQSVLGYAKGAEVQPRNIWGKNNPTDPDADADYSASGLSQSCGLWVVVNDRNGGSGIDFGNPFNTKFDVGISFKSANGGPCRVASIQDESQAPTSIQINGTHSVLALGVAHGAGRVQLGGGAWSSRLAVRPGATTDRGVVIQSLTSQTADLLTLADDTGAQLIGISPAGVIAFGSSGDATLRRDTSGRLKVTTDFNVNDKHYLQATGSYVMSGTGGNGYLEILEQSSPPATPSTTDRLRIYAEDVGGNDTAARFVDGGGFKARVAVVKSKGSPCWGFMPNSLTAGSNKTPVANTLYFTQVFVGNPCDLTGLGYAIGNVNSGNVIISIYDSEGTFVASTASTAVAGTQPAYQKIALIGNPIKLRAVGTYYVGVQFDNTTTRFQAFTQTAIEIATGAEAQGSFATPASITPSTTYTTSQGPVVITY